MEWSAALAARCHSSGMLAFRRRCGCVRSSSAAASRSCSGLRSSSPSRFTAAACTAPNSCPHSLRVTLGELQQQRRRARAVRLVEHRHELSRPAECRPAWRQQRPFRDLLVQRGVVAHGGERRDEPVARGGGGVVFAHRPEDLLDGGGGQLLGLARLPRRRAVAAVGELEPRRRHPGGRELSLRAGLLRRAHRGAHRVTRAVDQRRVVERQAGGSSRGEGGGAARGHLGRLLHRQTVPRHRRRQHRQRGTVLRWRVGGCVGEPLGPIVHIAHLRRPLLCAHAAGHAAGAISLQRETQDLDLIVQPLRKPQGRTRLLSLPQVRSRRIEVALLAGRLRGVLEQRQQAAVPCLAEARAHRCLLGLLEDLGAEIVLELLLERGEQPLPAAQQVVPHTYVLVRGRRHAVAPQVDQRSHRGAQLVAAVARLLQQRPGAILQQRHRLAQLSEHLQRAQFAPPRCGRKRVERRPLRHKRLRRRAHGIIVG
eukprot:scaffold48624_cov63-Phaeocystis_antarctica.AAC.4